MNGPKWLLVIWFSLSALITIGLVGEEREPISPSTAVGAVILNVAMIWAVLLA